MKKMLLITLLSLSLNIPQPAHAQAEEIQQLLLDLEKLNQFRAILDQLYKGYEILAKGYNTVKDLSQGNFNLHKLFLDKLLEISPAVKKYKRIVDIITCQTQLVKEYKAALSYFKNINVFSSDDMGYIQSVYGNLVDRTVNNLDELLMVITAQQLRMNDAERMNAIDKIYKDMEDKLTFLRTFNESTRLLANQKRRELLETQSLETIFGIQK